GRWRRDAVDVKVFSALFARRRKHPLRTAKPCGPGPPMLGSSLRATLANDGGYQARYPGESAEQPLKPLRREGRMLPSYLCNLRAEVQFFCTQGSRVRRAPGLPCAS